MRTVFAKPSNTYTIVLSKEDITKLIKTGGLLYMPLHMSNTYLDSPRAGIDSDGHFLQYHGPKEETIPVQFISIQLELERDK